MQASYLSTFLYAYGCMSTRFIFITGGVSSSLGKGVVTASIAAMLKARGYSIKTRKLDPYLNVDSGTMNPYQHGEVFITHDGLETDLDLGCYERFTGISTDSNDSITTGKIYDTLIKKERNGDYLGETVQIVPHIIDLIKNFITHDVEQADFVLCEVGGTVGDIEALPFFEAIRQMKLDQPDNHVLYVHLTLIPYLATAQEIKTKPTQHSVKELRSLGIQPDILVCRTEKFIPEEGINKLSLFCDVKKDCVIQAMDCENLYLVPLAYHNAGLDSALFRCCKMSDADVNPIDMSAWYEIKDKINAIQHSINIAIITKYTSFYDAYKSIVEAFKHVEISCGYKINLQWIDAEEIESKKTDISEILHDVNGVLVPGGFGARGINGKMSAIRYARENNIPFFGICLGMQLAIVEYARNVLNIHNAHSAEFMSNDSDQKEKFVEVISLLDKSKDIDGPDNGNEYIRGDMRTGGMVCQIKPHTLISKIYGEKDHIIERHRHRYEFNSEYTKLFEQNGMMFSATLQKNPSTIEVCELPQHKHFIAVQFHPEFTSSPFNANPLFVKFVEACSNKE